MKQRLIAWLDTYALLIATAFLAAFIPLYPKLPLFDVIPGYIVRARLEDVLIFSTIGLWLIQLFRRKVTWKTPLTYIIGAYAVVGLLSTVAGVFITKTIPFEVLHIGKTLLHYVRYMEYFSLFFIAFSAIKTRRDLKIFSVTVVLTLLGVFIYGLGQKYLYWPVYSTMNREFSKGMRLYLTEHARVQSTFGGHYDLGAYLVVIMPLIAVFAFASRRWWVKLSLWFAFVGGLWLLMLSASRSSLFSYVAGVGLAIALSAALQKNWKSRVGFFLSRSGWVSILTVLLLAQYGTDMYERLLQTLAAYPTLNKTYHDLNRERKDFFNVYLPSKIPLLASIRGIHFEAKKPDNGIAIDQVLTPSDQQPVATRPSDVYVDVPDYKQVATIAADGTATIATQAVPRTYSENAFEHGLSLAIRLDTLWPRAIEGFKRDPLLGSGYATLTKESTQQFTEAESTDNNFLRTLGETGALGFITFYGTIVLSCWYALQWIFGSHVAQNQKDSDRPSFEKLFAVGYVAGSLGLLVNAVYIDVYASSKVALTYWMIAGVTMGLLYQSLEQRKPKINKKRV